MVLIGNQMIKQRSLQISDFSTDSLFVRGYRQMGGYIHSCQHFRRQSSVKKNENIMVNPIVIRIYLYCFCILDVPCVHTLHNYHFK